MKKLFFALAATVALLGTQSCSKKDAAAPEKDVVAELSKQAKYSVSSFEMADADILDIVSGQFNMNSSPEKVNMELTVNESGAEANQVKTSVFKIGNYSGNIQTMQVDRIDKETVIISFLNNMSMFAGYMSSPPYAPQALLKANLLQANFNTGNPWYVLDCNQLTAVYKVAEVKTNETVTGFKFTKKGTPSGSFQINK